MPSRANALNSFGLLDQGSVAEAAVAAATLSARRLMRFGLSCGTSCAVALDTGPNSSSAVPSPMHMVMARRG